MRRMLDRAFDGIANSRIITPELVNTTTFPHRVDVWKPSPLTLNPDKEPADLSWVKVYSNQRAQLIATPETEDFRPQGRSKVNNIFTNDEWFFPTGLVLQDTWVIKMLSTLKDYQGLYWLLQGNTQGQEGFAFQVVSVQQVYAKIIPRPANLT